MNLGNIDASSITGIRRLRCGFGHVARDVSRCGSPRSCLTVWNDVQGLLRKPCGDTRTTQGAVWFDMSTDSSPTTHFWRKWGKEAVANAKAAQRDADYEDRGTVAFSVKGGKIVFSNTNMGTTFHWEFTPKGAPGAFLIEVTGGTFGVEGNLHCAR
jgi:hypothetical protein